MPCAVFPNTLSEVKLQHLLQSKNDTMWSGTNYRVAMIIMLMAHSLREALPHQNLLGYSNSAKGVMAT